MTAEIWISDSLLGNELVNIVWIQLENNLGKGKTNFKIFKGGEININKIAFGTSLSSCDWKKDIEIIDFGLGSEVRKYQISKFY